MLSFRQFELRDLPALRGCYDADQDTQCRICDATPGTAAMWRHTFDVRFSQQADTVLFAVRTPDGRQAFSYPIGADPEGMLQLLKTHCAETGQTPVFYLVSPSRVEPLRRVFGRLDMQADRNDFDYLYDYDALAGLAGRKYSAQRNHIHKFTATVPGSRRTIWMTRASFSPGTRRPCTKTPPSLTKRSASSMKFSTTMRFTA